MCQTLHRVHSETAGDIRFTYPDGRHISPGPDERFSGNVVALESNNRKNGLKITHETLPPMWTGEQMDYDLAILGLQSWE